ncbi:hypothetical protein DEI99_006870 [Curtobacterium sp. MCLR17_036]|uniref:hypothetical protein n=1 Tax=Curtobacterium sp. MCLR17_036 TaxID=2175620 RepID=UPI000DA81A2C|nr:hypothetical protein [Curtobacterium sp. MCLR17_036]WIE66249.1 hypothetical protein DEI99_006870 [Curtobacterium sp. MCLR17_036]
MPAQGGWLVFAMRDGGVWWLAWAVVLVGLVACTVVTAVQARRLGPTGRPVIATPVNVAVLLALFGWILVALAR